jgi:hypothetical protein
MKDANRWRGVLGAALGTHVFVAVIEDESNAFDCKSEELFGHVQFIIKEILT